MAITHFLLQSNINSNPMLQQTFHLRPLCFPSTKRPCIAIKNKHSPCCIKASPKFNIKCSIMNYKAKGEEGNNLNGVIWRSMGNVMKALQITLITMGLLFLYNHHQCRLAVAATGGRMGGRLSSSSSSSRSSGSTSYSSRSSRPSYTSSTSYSTQTSPMTTANEVEPNAFQVIRTSFVVFFVLYLLSKCLDGDQDTAKSTVLMLQVGSLGTGRSLQKDLNRIAETVDTSTSKGFSYVLQETIVSLLQHSDYCISGYSSVDVNKGVKEGEKRFDQLSIEERGKFDEETLVNVNNIRMKSATSQSSNGLRNEYIVVTIIVAARGVLELSPVKNSEQLKKALQKLASIPTSNLIGVEVLWTPQKEDDSLTEQEMLKDYPLLHPL
ncbi:hypothetical protein L1987_74515 [Smallanthus sonchifolius]|uniref:Uncharacterized protein n=1 Tax=Smallanthus sonchifolius TaxID=185202 RepID=A0ACB9A2W2_9ASTR|nr:hypothetical protein L1987_74515 [Smallanthus sonchifolius]